MYGSAAARRSVLAGAGEAHRALRCRQERVGPFIADFYCHDERLVIEVDGGIHATPEKADSDGNRDVYLLRNRLRVLRFTNRQVIDETESVLRQIAATTGRWDDSVPPSDRQP